MGLSSFVDLACFERIKGSGSAGNQLNNVQSITKSLSVASVGIKSEDSMQLSVVKLKPIEATSEAFKEFSFNMVMERCGTSLDEYLWSLAYCHLQIGLRDLLIGRWCFFPNIFSLNCHLQIVFSFILQ
ncbi:hypothetical protein L6452_22456 [Arctium lappa]|uniref:Uncharacterized protein n=1 Tax=Arctium lappa TaxID=4217 RepID=A0ACB9B1K2_ARCLA|nr:hypothetical protein L6452_22456 [Arctium lappa]